MAIAIDLDGTLAEYHGWVGDHHIGPPIPRMLSFVNELINDGKQVVIFSARADNPKAIEHIRIWLKRHGLPDLHITNIKLKSFERIYDDRAIRVERNKGIF